MRCYAYTGVLFTRHTYKNNNNSHWTVENVLNFQETLSHNTSRHKHTRNPTYRHTLEHTLTTDKWR